MAQLPQWLADRFGWEQLVMEVTTVYESLPDEEKRNATILAPSYGHAGAIELFGRGLPPVISPHNSYFLWGKDTAERLSRGVAVTLGYDEEDLRDVYRTVERVGVYDCQFCMPWRDQMGSTWCVARSSLPTRLAPPGKARSTSSREESGSSGQTHPRAATRRSSASRTGCWLTQNGVLATGELQVAAHTLARRARLLRSSHVFFSVQLGNKWVQVPPRRNGI